MIHDPSIRPMSWEELGFNPHAGWQPPRVQGWADAARVLNGPLPRGAGIYVVALRTEPDAAAAWPVDDVGAHGGTRIVYVGRSEQLLTRLRAFCASAGLDGDWRNGHYAGHRLRALLDAGEDRARVRFAWLTPGGDAQGDFAYLWSTVVEGLVLARVSGGPGVGVLPVLQNGAWMAVRANRPVAEVCAAAREALTHPELTEAGLLELGTARLGQALAENVTGVETLPLNPRWHGWRLGGDLYLYVGRTEPTGCFVTLWSRDRQVYPHVEDTRVEWGALPDRVADVLSVALLHRAEEAG